MTSRDANERKATRWIWGAVIAALATVLVAAIVRAPAIFALMIIPLAIAWGCGFWVAHARGYSAWLALLGPLVCMFLPNLHPILDAIPTEPPKEERDG